MDPRPAMMGRTWRISSASGARRRIASSGPVNSGGRPSSSPRASHSSGPRWQPADGSSRFRIPGRSLETSLSSGSPSSSTSPHGRTFGPGCATSARASRTTPLSSSHGERSCSPSSWSSPPSSSSCSSTMPSCRQRRGCSSCTCPYSRTSAGRSSRSSPSMASSSAASRAFVLFAVAAATTVLVLQNPGASAFVQAWSLGLGILPGAALAGYAMIAVGMTAHLAPITSWIPTRTRQRVRGSSTERSIEVFR